MNRNLTALLVAAAFAYTAAPAVAGPEELKQARAYFDTGAKEYEKGNYLNAIRAFEQAYELSSRPGPLFSIAQAYRNQYSVDPKTIYLKKAAEYYRLYLAKEPQGKRKGEVISALGNIEVMLARISVEAATEVAGVETTLATQISITSNVDEAKISIDGGEPRPLDAIDVKPGKHKVVISADGYYPEERTIDTKEGRITAVDVPLREKPAEIVVSSISGADVVVDGVPRGSTPLGAPIKIDGGVHIITVTHNGYKGFNEEIEIKRGEKKDVVAPLTMTKQRIASYVLFGTGAASAGLGIIFALGAAADQAQALKIDDQRQKSFIEDGDREKYNELLQSRDDSRIAAGVMLGSAFALGATGAMLFFFDQPTLSSPTKRVESKPAAPTSPSKPGETTMEVVGGAPILLPGLYGASLQGRF